LAEGTKIVQRMTFLKSQNRQTGSSASLRVICLKGTIVSGKREGAKFIRLPWVRKQIVDKLGFIPYSGTLNVKIVKDDASKLKEFLKKAKITEISPAEGFCRGRCFKACLMEKVECAVVIPQVPDYPEDTIEIISPANLRKKLHLKDGDTIDVKMTF
jgi:riboflavin kinase